MLANIGHAIARFCEGLQFKSAERTGDGQQSIQHVTDDRAPISKTLLEKVSSRLPEKAREWLEKRFGSNDAVHKPAVVKDGLFEAKKGAVETQAKQLFNAWPKDWPRSEPGLPKEFDAIAFALQLHKETMFETAASSSGVRRTDRLQAAVRIGEIAHGKRGHTANLVSVTGKFLRDPQILGLLEDTASTTAIKEAVKWLNLADRDVPVSVLAAKRPPSQEDKARYIDTRMTRSADIFREYRLGDESIAQVIGQVRYVQGERPLAAQFIDLIDRISAMAAKPFFQKEGKADVDKIFSAIEKDLQKEGANVNSGLFNSVRACALRGDLDNALLESRPEDLYVRT